MKEIFFKTTNRISGMCEDYMELVYKDSKEHSLYKPGELSITLCDDVLRIYGDGFSLGIDVSREDKNRFRLFLAYNTSE